MSATIRLERIQEPSFNDFLETMLPLYIEERSAADHVSKTVAEQFARQQHAELLPHGYHTPGHYFARIIDEVTNGAVGSVWFRLDASSGEAYIYYIGCTRAPSQGLCQRCAKCGGQYCTVQRLRSACPQCLRGQ